MEQGDVERKILEQCMRSGEPIPQRIENAPRLQLGLQFYWTAFMELNTCRPPGVGGPTYIPWTAILDYCLYLGIDEDGVDEVVHCIRAMDVAYIAHWVKKHGKKPRGKRTKVNKVEGPGDG